MNIRVMVFSAIALAGVAGLLAIGLNGSLREPHGHELDEHQVRERAAVLGIVESGDTLSLEQILQNARQQHAGRVLEAELEENSGGLYYKVEILDDNSEVWEMNFDARTGELLGEEQED